MPRKPKEKKPSAVTGAAEKQTQISSTANTAEETRTEPRVDGLTTAGPEPSTSGRSQESPESTPKEKIIVTLRADGSVDLEAMRDKTRDRLKAAILRSGDALYPAKNLPVTRFPEEAVYALYGILGMVEATAAAAKFGPEVGSVFQYNKQELNLLMEPTQAVLAKHLDKFTRFQEESTLVLVLAQIHFAKFHQLRQVLAEKANAQTQPQGQTQTTS